MPASSTLKRRHLAAFSAAAAGSLSLVALTLWLAAPGDLLDARESGGAAVRAVIDGQDLSGWRERAPL